MENFKTFIKGTKNSTRILFVLWIVLSVISNFSDESKFLIALEYAIMLLLPAALIELKKNPLFENSQSGIVLFCRRAKRISKILFYLWVLTSVLILSGANWNVQEVSSSLVFGAIVFLLPTIFLERNNFSVDENADERNIVQQSSPKKQSDKRVRKSLVAGLCFAPIALIGLVAYLQNPIDDPTTGNQASGNLSVAIVFGFLAILFLLISTQSPKTKTEAAERKAAKLAKKEHLQQQLAQQRRMLAYKGIFLSEQQIHKLESKVELPVVDTPVFLSHGEVAVYYSTATRQETKNRVVGRTGGYSGGTIRIAKGFSIHTGGSSSRPVYGEVSTHYEGEMVLTNKRLIFLSDQKAFEVPYTSITAATAYSDGISIQSRNHTYTLILPKAELAVIAFDAVRTGEIPIANTATYCANCNNDFDDDLDFEIEIEDHENISSVDGMGGHEFEYFSAELLRKNGFSNVRVTPGSGDQGVDILAEKGGIKYAIQCKNYTSALGNTPVQEVNAGKLFYNCHVGVVLTNSTFTPGAKKLADATGVLLWDRTELQKMIDTTNIGQLSANPTSYSNFDTIVDEDDVLTEIQDLIDLSVDAMDPMEDALDRFVNAVESAAFQSVPMDKELLRLGNSAKKLGADLNKINEQIKEKSLTLLGSLAKQGYDGWSTEQSFVESITGLHKLQQKLTQGFVSMKGTIARMENQYGVNNSSFRLAKQQALHDIEQGISATKKASSSFADILSEYRKFKTGSNSCD